MGIDFTKTSHIVFFAAFLPFVSYFTAFGTSILWPDAPFWVETLSPLAAYGLFYTLFNRLAWKLPLFRWLGIVQTRDMGGRWYGTQLSSYKKDGKPMKSRIILEVEQTFSDISARAYYKRWQSAHCNSSLMRIDGEPCLILIFESEPGVYHDGEDTRHKGVAQLTYSEQDDKIRGSYFNTNGNNGVIVLNRSTKPLLRRFEV